ncbi:MAG: Rrf2 family transcriptional regulator [Pseudomonadota bacterium]
MMLKVSTRGRYGLLAMVELACAYGGKPVQLTAIADKHGISRKYLHNLMTTLRGAGFVRSARGAHGGFLLAGDPSLVNLRDILLTLEGEVLEQGVSSDPGSVVDEVFAEVSNGLRDQLALLTLDKLATRARQRAGNLMFYI